MVKNYRIRYSLLNKDHSSLFWRLCKDHVLESKDHILEAPLVSENFIGENSRMFALSLEEGFISEDVLQEGIWYLVVERKGGNRYILVLCPRCPCP